mgnify:CR=1 FL=1
MAIKYHLKAAVSEYTDQSGQAKKRYQTVGIVMETAKGDLMMKLETMPMLAMKEGALWAYLNVPDEKDDNKKPSGRAEPDNLDDIPF